MEVIPRSHKNRTQEVPVIYIGTKNICAPDQLCNKSAGSLVHCNDVAPLRFKLGKVDCSYLEMRECQDPAMLPVDDVNIDPSK